MVLARTEGSNRNQGRFRDRIAEVQIVEWSRCPSSTRAT